MTYIDRILALENDKLTRRISPPTGDERTNGQTDKRMNRRANERTEGRTTALRELDSLNLICFAKLGESLALLVLS